MTPDVGEFGAGGVGHGIFVGDTAAYFLFEKAVAAQGEKVTVERAALLTFVGEVFAGTPRRSEDARDD